MPVPVLSPGLVSPITFPPIGRLPSAVSATGSHQLCSRHHRYYAAVRLLISPAMASSSRLPAAAQYRHAGMGKVRSPRFRCFPFVRNGVSDHGRAPSTFSTASASATLNFSWLNIPLRMIAVYASRPSSPAAPQHSLKGGSLLPYPRRTLTGWKAPASPGALRMFLTRSGNTPDTILRNLFSGVRWERRSFAGISHPRPAARDHRNSSTVLPCSTPVRSMVRFIARSGRDCASPEPARRCGGCSG
jgi:hypothetical protein